MSFWLGWSCSYSQKLYVRNKCLDNCSLNSPKLLAPHSNAMCLISSTCKQQLFFYTAKTLIVLPWSLKMSISALQIFLLITVSGEVQIDCKETEKNLVFLNLIQKHWKNILHIYIPIQFKTDIWSFILIRVGKQPAQYYLHNWILAE